jgi:hypothetical protein
VTEQPSQPFEAVRHRLRAIVARYEGRGLRQNPSDEDGDLTLIGPATHASRGRDVWFGGVQVRKRYVSYHLMPVYVFPDLLDGISEGLKKRMQGKSCFNFTHVDEHLFHELEQVTDRGYRRFVSAELIL